MKTLRVAGDVCLFVTGDEGILFSESRQEIYTLNTSATLLWCLMEEGVSLDDMVDVYARTFSVSRSQAEEHVYPMLRRWFGLGHIADPEIPAPGQMPLSEALAYLLTNRELRDAFGAEGGMTAAALGVIEGDRPAFLALESGALDWHANEITRLRIRKRHGASPQRGLMDDADLLEAATLVPMGSDSVRCVYRVLDTTFEVTMSPSLQRIIEPVFAHLRSESAPADVSIHVRDSVEGCVVFDGLVPVFWHQRPEAVTPSLKVLFRRLAVARHPYFMEVHAGVVRIGDGALLLPGRAGSGKTTLTAALVHLGAEYLSDEIALLEERDLGVCAIPLAMTVKPGSVEELHGLYPAVDTLIEHRREDHQPVRYLPPPADRIYAARTPLPVKWVVFPTYTPGAETVVERLSVTQGLRQLVDESLVLPGQLDKSKVEMLVDWARGLEFHVLRHSSTASALHAVRQITGGP